VFEPFESTDFREAPDFGDSFGAIRVDASVGGLALRVGAAPGSASIPPLPEGHLVPAPGTVPDEKGGGGDGVFYV